jgi:hypothetical protein
MADDIASEQVAAVAAAARVPLDAAAAARVARTMSPAAARLAAPDVSVPFEVEPATFLAVARRERKR